MADNLDNGSGADANGSGMGHAQSGVTSPGKASNGGQDRSNYSSSKRLNIDDTGSNFSYGLNYFFS
jgi:hypothetical protein